MPSVHPFFTKKRVKGEEGEEREENVLLTKKALQKCGRESAPWPKSYQLVKSETRATPVEPVLKKHITTTINDYFSLTEKRKFKTNEQSSHPAITLPRTPPTIAHNQDLSMKIATRLHDSSDNLIILLHGPSGSGKTHFAEHVLPAALGRRLFLLDASLPRTAKSFDPLLQHLLHSHPHSSMLLIDSLECLFAATERSFPAALSAFLAQMSTEQDGKGFLIVLTSEWDQGKLNSCLGIKFPFSMKVESFDNKIDSCSNGDCKMDGSSCCGCCINTASIHSATNSCDGYCATASNATTSLGLPLIKPPFAPFEGEQPLDELLWTNQIPDESNQPNFTHHPLQRRIQRRFFEYGRSLNRSSLWHECLLHHVLSLEHYHSLQPESQRRGRRVAHYKYIVDESLLQLVINKL